MKKKKSLFDNLHEIEFNINRKKVRIKIPPTLMLIELIREKLGLLGTKPGCHEGECGACSVLVNGASVNSCLYPALNADGQEITTVEGLLSEGKMDEVQQAMIHHGAVQCGFCSPGMAISIKSMQNYFKKKKCVPTRKEIQKMLEGNLCRCTGYVKIIDAAEKLFAKED